MIRYSKCLIASLLTMSMSAHATLFNFEYTGRVAYLYGNGLGHNVGQDISGHLNFDLANAYDDLFPESFATGYRARTDLDFVKGYLPASSYRNMDHVYVYDSIDGNHVYHADGGITIADGLYNEYSNSEATGSLNYGLELDIRFDDFDWLTDGQVNEFSFNENDFADGYHGGGQFYEFNNYTKADGSKVYGYDGASFILYSAKLTQVDVPEGSPVWLLLWGGLIFRLVWKVNHRRLGWSGA